MANFDFVEYRVALIEPDSRAVLAMNTGNGCSLPHVHIPKGTRPAEQLRNAISSTLDLHVLILDLLAEGDKFMPCAIAELLTPLTSRNFERIGPDQLPASELTNAEHSALVSILQGETKTPFTRIGWLDEATVWIKALTGRRVSKWNIKQLNAGGAFALVRFHADDGWNCWMKATGEPNEHELLVTALLSKLCKGYLPEFLGSRPKWNAWLSSEATTIPYLSVNPFELFGLLEDAAESLAELQMRTASSESELLNAGAFDQRLDALLKHSDAFFDYLDQVMDLSASRDLPCLERKRLQEIRIVFQMVCERLQQLKIPETIVHGDLNPSNILIGREHCQFIDWSEAYVGPCFITLEHLLLLANGITNLNTRRCMKISLQQKYASVWAAACNADSLTEGFCYMPFVAAVSALYGRGDCLNSPDRYDVRRLSYATTLATYIDRAMRSVELQEELRSLRTSQLCVTAAAPCP